MLVSEVLFIQVAKQILKLKKGFSEEAGKTSFNNPSLKSL